jgi:hypothetical protein
VKFEGGAPVEFHFLLIAASAAAQAEGRRFKEVPLSRFADSVAGAPGFPALGTA